MHSQTEIFRRIVRDHMRPPAPVLKAGASIGEAVALLGEARSPQVIVADGQGRPLGILTPQDVVRRVIWRASPEDRVETVASRPVVTVTADEPLYKAIAMLRERRLTRLPAVDGAGRLEGLLELTDALAGLTGPALALAETLAGADTIEGWRGVKAALVDTAEAMLSEEAPVHEIQALIAEINADLHRRALNKSIAELDADGWGPPPVPFSLIVMGSGGREESSLASDQDNGLIVADHADADSARIDGYFLALADRLTKALDRIGFGLCKGNVMCTNPVWRKRLEEWREQVSHWIRARAPMHLLQADILFDFRHIAGAPELSRELREHATATAAKSPQFVRDLLGIGSDHRVALGWFGVLSKEEDENSRPGMINLKMRGTLPLVDAARLLALSAGIPETSTRARLERLTAVGRLEPQDRDYLIAAQRNITRILLSRQIADFRAGRAICDYVPESALSKMDKEQLVAGLRSIETLRATLAGAL